jgi:translation initiation factor 4E
MEVNINPEMFTKLGKTYTLWYHNPNENNWLLNSYHEIMTFSTVEEFLILQNFITENMILYGMFFLMQDGIAPVWEDPSNINGGVLSWKVDNTLSYEYWLDIAKHYVSNNLFSDCSANDIVTGICISPKKNSNIIKIWINKTADYTKFAYAPTLILMREPAIFKSHRNNIEKDSMRTTTDKKVSRK